MRPGELPWPLLCPAAILTAEASMTVFRVAFECWVEQTNEQDLQQLIRESLNELRAVTTA